MLKFKRLACRYLLRLRAVLSSITSRAAVSKERPAGSESPAAARSSSVVPPLLLLLLLSRCELLALRHTHTSHGGKGARHVPPGWTTGAAFLMLAVLGPQHQQDLHGLPEKDVASPGKRPKFLRLWQAWQRSGRKIERILTAGLHVS